MFRFHTRFSRCAGLCLLLAAAFSAAANPAPSAVAQDPPRFDIWEFQVEGNTVLPEVAIERAVYPHLGEGRNFDDVDAARGNLAHAYREAGYATVLVDIPEQSVSSGIVILRVTESRLEAVKVSGARYYSQERILEQVSALQEGEAPYFPAMENQLADVNRSPDRRVEPLLRPGRRPGTTEVEFKVDDSLPLHGSVELNDRYGPSRAPQPGTYRASASLRYDNLWQREHSLALQILRAPGHSAEAKVNGITYTVPLQGADVLAFYAVRSDSNSDLAASLEGANVLGKGDTAGVRYVHPLAARDDFGHSLTLGLDYKHFMETLQQGASAFQTPLTYWMSSVAYGATLTDAGGATSLGGRIGFSLRGLRNNDIEFDQKRFRGQSNFFVLRWDAQRVQRLPLALSLTARLEGQFATLPLVGSEQFAIGGIDSVRGYPEATQVGDHGARGLIELRSPQLLGGEGPDAFDLRLVGFYERAGVVVIDPLPGQAERFHLAASGLGLRLRAFGGFLLSLDRARRLKDGKAADTHGDLAAGGVRWHLSASYQF